MVPSGFEELKTNKLIAFCRLRLPQKSTKPIFPTLKNTALIRELHTYGQMVGLDKKNEQSRFTSRNYKKAAQHSGWGKKLITKAEKIARTEGYKKIAVIAGIGVREYYRHLGYHLKDTYLIKKIN